MQAYRPTTMGVNGMVTSPHYLASQAGMKILQEGGNAVEAAIAVASTLSVVYPQMNGIGGDNFWLVYNAETKALKGLNASGKSAKDSSIRHYREKGYQKIPARGYEAAITVPGAVSGWGKAFQYSQEEMAGKKKWASLLADAAAYAESGFPVTPAQHRLTEEVVENHLDGSEQYREFRRVFLDENGAAYQPGEIFKQEDLAETLKLIAAKGASGFYEGVVAEQLTADIQKNGGLLALEDFQTHQAEWVEPISVDYRGHKAYNLPPNTQGIASLSILNILNQFDLSTVEEGSADYYHIIIEATRLAFRDRDQWVTDPEFADIPVESLLSEAYGQQLADQIKQEKPAGSEKLLDPKGDTVWFGVVDKWGNAVSLIQSIYHEFGSAVVPKGTGVLLQNRGCYFSLQEDALNKLEPGKRTLHTLNPAMLFKEGNPYLVYGTMGGEGQPQTQAALVTRIVDYGYGVQEAIEAPRWLFGRTWGASSNSLKLESRISSKIAEELKKRNHLVEMVPEFSDVMGHSGVIRIDPENNVKHGGADPRGDGAALGY